MSKRTLGVLTTVLALYACPADEDPVVTPGRDGGVSANRDAGTNNGGSIGPVMGFTSAANGFSFQNYTNDGVMNMSPAQMRRIYGDAVCAMTTGGTCQLKPTAKQWMLQVNDAMKGGHCEGMAVLSLMLFHGIESPMTYGGNATPDLALNGNLALQQDIARYFAMQVPLAMRRIPGTPLEQVDRLRPTFEAGATENYTIAFFKADYTGGHAVTPYGVVDNGNGTLGIQVYDNNFPGQERQIVVDMAMNSWTYEAAANPGNPASVYIGDATTNTLLLVPLSARLDTLNCTFCGNVMAQPTMPRTVASSGEADILVTDQMGRRLGRMNGALINEIPGANAVALLSDDLWADDQDPFYEIPGGLDLTIDVSGADLAEPEPTSVSIAGPGYVLAVDDIVLDPGQIDTVEFAGDAPDVYYETEGAETALVVLAIETDAADWAFAIQSRGDSNGQAIFASADFAAGELVFGFDGADAESEFDLIIERVDDGGVIEFYHQAIVVPNGAILVVPYVDFDQDGETLDLLVDVDDDGMIDDTLSLSDDR